MYTLGIDIGGTSVRIGLIDRGYNLSFFEKLSSSDVASPEALAELINSFAAKYNVQNAIKSVCVGFPATVSKDKTTVLNAPNFKGFDGINVKDALEGKISYPVLVDKDVNLLVLCDLFQNDCKARDIVACYIGTGLGNAIMIDGKFISGFNGVAGELGHIPFGDTENSCGCGNFGCAEALVGGKYLADLAKALNVHISELFEKHGESANVKEYLDRLARVIAAEINIIDPELLILGGGVIGMNAFPKEAFVNNIRKYVRKPLPCDALNVIFSDNTAKCGVIGAGIRAWKEINERN